MTVYLTNTRYTNRLFTKNIKNKNYSICRKDGCIFIPYVSEIRQHKKCAFWVVLNIAGMATLMIKKSSLRIVAQ